MGQLEKSRLSKSLAPVYERWRDLAGIAPAPVSIMAKSFRWARIFPSRAAAGFLSPLQIEY